MRAIVTEIAALLCLQNARASFDKFSTFVLSARDAFWPLISVTAGALGASFGMDDPKAVGSPLRPIVSRQKPNNAPIVAAFPGTRATVAND
jgi:hypothetical protein